MAEQDLTLVIKAVDDATKTLKDVKKQLGEVTKETEKNTKANKNNSKSQKEQSGGLKNLAAGFSRLGPVVAGATAAIGTITAVLTKSNAEYAQQNRLNKNLEQNLRNMGLSATAASIQLNKLNSEFDAMSRITNFDDEALSASFNKLLLVTKDVTEAQKALKVSMDLSATSGKSLEDTSQKVLKAYNGEYMELVELGVITKQQAEEFQKMSDKGKATADVMDILAQKTKGAAENLTEAEKMSRDLNASMDGLWETIGQGSSKVLGSFNELLIEMTGGQGVGKGVFELLGDQVDDATNSITTLFRALKDKDAISALKMLYNLRTGSDTFAPVTTAQERGGRVSRVLGNRGIEMTPEIQSFIEQELRSIASFDPAEDKKIAAIIEKAAARFANQRTVTIAGPEQAAGDPTALSQGRASRATLEGNMAARAAKKSSYSSSPKDTRTELQKANDEMDVFQKKLEDRVNSVNDLYQERLDKEAEERELAREKGRIERENLIKQHDLREKQRENDRKHQAWLKSQEEARMASMVANINQVSGLLQQGLSMVGGENASGLSSIVGGAAQGVTSYFSGNPMGMISGALSIVDGISSLFGGGDAAKADEERRKRKEEERKAFEAAKRERVEFQKSLQSAIVDALRESRDNLAVTYIINQSGNYLGNDNASLRQVQSALQGTGRLERNRT
ncbi:MAG: hypothetical protein ACR2MR_13540 [Dietzia maris]